MNGAEGTGEDLFMRAECNQADGDVQVKADLPRCMIGNIMSMSFRLVLSST